MILAALILVLIVGASEVDLFIGISNLTNYLHSQCLIFTPESFHAEIYASLVCGKSLSSTELSQNLKNLGIYHVIIVSGSHLVFLSLLIEKFFYNSALRHLRYAAFPILLLYSLATGAEPPVIRALISIGVEAAQRKQKLFWNQNEVIFISVLTCLALCESWENSYSLLLSYIASVALSLTDHKSIVTKNLWIYALILPFLLPLSAPNPLSFLTNMILSPLIGLVLFPLSFIAFIVPYFYVLVDPLWKIFLWICSILGPELTSLERIAVPISFLWFLAVMLNFYGMYKDKRGLYVIA